MKKKYIIGSVFTAIVIVVLVTIFYPRQGMMPAEEVEQGLSSSTVPVANTESQSVPATVPVTKPATLPVPVLPATTTEMFVMKLGEIKHVGGLELAVEKIKDTRCRSGITCATANDVRVLLSVAGPYTSKNVSFVEEQAFYVDNKKVILTNVTPEVKRSKIIAPEEYEFHITVESVQFAQ